MERSGRPPNITPHNNTLYIVCLLLLYGIRVVLGQKRYGGSLRRLGAQGWEVLTSVVFREYRAKVRSLQGLPPETGGRKRRESPIDSTPITWGLKPPPLKERNTWNFRDTTLKIKVSLDLEIDFHGFDERHQPGQQFLMRGTGPVSFQRGAVGELHHAAKCITLGARGEVRAHPSLEQAGDLSLQGADFGLHAELLLLGNTGLPAKSKSVYDHAGIVAEAGRNRTSDLVANFCGMGNRAVNIGKVRRAMIK